MTCIEDTSLDPNLNPTLEKQNNVNEPNLQNPNVKADTNQLADNLNTVDGKDNLIDLGDVHVRDINHYIAKKCLI